MDNKLAQVKIGLMVLTAVVIVIASVVWGKSMTLSRSYETYRIFFPDVIGLEKSAEVLVNGVPRGRVEKFELRPEGVIVKIRLKDSVVLYTDAYALIESPGLMASKAVALIPGASGEPFPQDELIPGQRLHSYTQMIASVVEIGGRLTSTLDEIHNTSAALRNVITNPSINETIENLSAAVVELRRFAASGRTGVDSALSNMNSLVSRAGNFVEKSEAKIDTLLTSLTVLSYQMRGIAASVDTIAQSVSSGESTLGKLVKDDQLYNDLIRTLGDLDSLIVLIRNKGVKTKVSIF